MHFLRGQSYFCDDFIRGEQIFLQKFFLLHRPCNIINFVLSLTSARKRPREIELRFKTLVICEIDFTRGRKVVMNLTLLMNS